jgi:isopropylmalate/homocitrate/citramalate synthase
MGEPRIHILDVTNRDGVQTSRLGLAKLEKTILNLLLNELGVAQSEFGFPFTRHETNYLNANLELAARGVLAPIVLSGWCTARLKEVESAFSLVPRLTHMNISVSTSPQMIQGKFSGGKNLTEIIDMMAAAVRAAYARGAVFVAVNAEDASRTPLEDLIAFIEAGRAAGARRFRYCDTLGYDDPRTTYERIGALAERTKMDVEMHCHNDLGMAVANSVAGAQAAVDAGVSVFINTTVNGMGERAGNADMLSVLLALKHASGLAGTYPLDERLDLSKAWGVAKYAAYAFGVPIPINQPGVGANAFAHESGIHADGALKDRRNYELYHFEELGRGEPEVVETGRQITVGEYSGIKGFRNVYDKLEIEFKDDAEAEQVLELARYANVHTQKPLTSYELKFIAQFPELARQIMTVTP